MPEKLDKKSIKHIENLTLIGRDVFFGSVEFDHEKCIGCGLCAQTCAADAIYLDEKKPSMRPSLEGQCMSCCDCVAICPESAIMVATFIQFKHHFRYLDRGEPMLPRRF